MQTGEQIMTAVSRRRPPSGKGLTYEKVWATIQEVAELQKETARQFRETDRRFKENARSFKKTERWHKETDRIVGKLSNRFGELVEHLVAPNINEKFNKRGFHFTQISTNMKFADPETLKVIAEVDVYLENSDSVIAVEVKAKPNIDDVNDHIRRMGILRRHADWRQDKRRYQGR
jgi:hypothetical protein